MTNEQEQRFQAPRLYTLRTNTPMPGTITTYSDQFRLRYQVRSDSCSAPDAQRPPSREADNADKERQCGCKAWLKHRLAWVGHLALAEEERKEQQERDRVKAEGRRRGRLTEALDVLSR